MIIIGRVKVSHPTQLKTYHIREVLPRQSLSLVQKTKHHVADHHRTGLPWPAAGKTTSFITTGLGTKSAGLDDEKLL